MEWEERSNATTGNKQKQERKTGIQTILRVSSLSDRETRLASAKESGDDEETREYTAAKDGGKTMLRRGTNEKEEMYRNSPIP